MTGHGTRVLRVRDLTVVWPADAGEPPSAPALDHVSLDVDAGEVVLLVGHAGSGRTTLLRALNGVVPRLLPGDVIGTVEIAGLDPAVTTVADLAQVVAVVLDDPEGQVTQTTVTDEVAFALENLGVPPDEILGRVTDAIERVGLGGFGPRHPHSLSGGEQQRLAVACAVAMRPRLLLMDQPTANLDPPSGRRVIELARTLAADGTAVILASDDVDLAAGIASRVIWLHAGRIRMDGQPDAVCAAMLRAGHEELAPAVTALVARLDASAGSLPVTVEAAVARLVGGP